MPTPGSGGGGPGAGGGLGLCEGGGNQDAQEPPKMGFKNNYSPNFNRKPKISHRSIVP